MRKRSKPEASKRPKPEVSEDRDFHSFFELAGVGNAIADPSTQKFLRVNRTFAEITGYSREELIGMTAEEITHPDDRNRDQMGWTRFLKSAKPHFEIEKRYIRKNGSVAWVHVTSTLVLDDTGAPIHAIGVVRDITDRLNAIDALKSERKFLEKALFEAAEREQRRIGQELHDHLCQQLLGAAFAAKAIGGDLEKSGSAVAPRLNDLAKLINEAVVQVREISRGLHPVESDAAGLMSALQELVKHVSHTVRCSFRCPGTVLIENPEAASHAYRIAQESVMNSIQTKASHINLSLTQVDGSACLKVSDDGKVEGELTAQPDGTAAKTLQYRAHAMGGHLSMNFRQRGGSRVVYTFPRKS